MRAGRTTVEGHSERRTLDDTMRQALRGWIRVPSPRQLPTDHDYDGGPQVRSANIRLINRRHELLDRLLPCSREQQRTHRGRRKRGAVLTGRSISVLCLRNLFAIGRRCIPSRFVAPPSNIARYSRSSKSAPARSDTSPALRAPCGPGASTPFVRQDTSETQH